jgi:putative membrane protein
MTAILTAWVFEPSVLAGVALTALAYMALTLLTGRRGRPPGTGRIVAFMLGLLLLLLALLSPLDLLADGYLLSAHMIQHLLLLAAVPPLLLLGVPRWVWRAVVATRPGDLAERLLGQPLVAFLLYTAALTVWHLPPYYDAALDDERVHIVEHLCFLLAATIFWWVALAPLPERDRPGPLGRVLYLFAAGIPNTVVAAALTFAPQPLYAPYVAPVDSRGLLPLIRQGWGLTALGDQQLAGVLMWIPMGLLLSGLALLILIRALDGPPAARSRGRAGAEPRALPLH